MADRRSLLAASAGYLTLALAATAFAAPKTPRAKAEFDRGVAAYRAKDWKTANAAFKKSNELEHDIETMFALAQTERQLEHCEAANVLYDEILADKALPKGNRDAIEKARGECVEILAATPPPTPPVHVEPDPPPPPHVDKPPPARRHHHHWYADGAGDAFTISGLVAIGVSPYLHHLAIGDRNAARAATTHEDLLSLSSRANTEYNAFLGCAIGGGVLVAVGIGWYVTHRDSPAPPVTAWITPDGGGLAFARGF